MKDVITTPVAAARPLDAAVVAARSRRDSSEKGNPLPSPIATVAASAGEKQAPLRIVHTVSSLQVGGMEHFVLRIAAAQHKAGHRVTVLAILDGPLLEEARRLGLHTVVLGAGGGKVGRALRAALAFARFRPDVINVHNKTSLHFAALGKRVSGARLVITHHGQGWGGVLRTPTTAEWQITDASVAVSEGAAAQMREVYPIQADKMSVIPNGVTVTPPARSRAEVRASLGIKDSETVGIMVARVDRLKGYDTLVAAAAELRDRNSAPVTLLLVGDGPDRARIEELVKQHRLGQDRVRLLGFRSDVPDLLGASDFFLLPSLTEGMPLSILEAMSQGLPVIATPVGGIPEVMEHGKHGLLTPVEDPAALADAIATLTTDVERRRSFGSAALQRVHQHFSFDAMVARYEDLYYRLCRGERRHG